LWLIDEFAIDLDDLAGYRRIQIRRGLDGFDHTELFARLDVIAHFGELDIHDVAQLVLGKGGDADDEVLALRFDPLVLGGVPPIGRVGCG